MHAIIQLHIVLETQFILFLYIFPLSYSLQALLDFPCKQNLWSEISKHLKGKVKGWCQCLSSLLFIFFFFFPTFSLNSFLNRSGHTHYQRWDNFKMFNSYFFTFSFLNKSGRHYQLRTLLNFSYLNMQKDKLVCLFESITTKETKKPAVLNLI